MQFKLTFTLQTPTHLQAHFYFFATHNSTAEKIKKSLQANAPDSADSANLIRHNFGRTEGQLIIE